MIFPLSFLLMEIHHCVASNYSAMSCKTFKKKPSNLVSLPTSPYSRWSTRESHSPFTVHLRQALISKSQFCIGSLPTSSLEGTTKRDSKPKVASQTSSQLKRSSKHWSHSPETYPKLKFRDPMSTMMLIKRTVDKSKIIMLVTVQGLGYNPTTSTLQIIRTFGKLDSSGP